MTGLMVQYNIQKKDICWTTNGSHDLKNVLVFETSIFTLQRENSIFKLILFGVRFHTLCFL